MALDKTHTDDAARIALLERALRYYANPKNWMADDWGIHAVIGEYAEAGAKARRALDRSANLAKADK